MVKLFKLKRGKGNERAANILRHQVFYPWPGYYEIALHVGPGRTMITKYRKTGNVTYKRL